MGIYNMYVGWRRGLEGASVSQTRNNYPAAPTSPMHTVVVCCPVNKFMLRAEIGVEQKPPFLGRAR